METVNLILQEIKDIRVTRKPDLNELAKAVGFETAKGYYDLESGRTKLTVLHLEKIASYYGLELSYFFDEKITKKVI